MGLLSVFIQPVCVGAFNPFTFNEVEDVGHARAVAQEAANADLEHDGNHQDPVPAGGVGWDRLRRVDSGQRQARRRWGLDGHQGAGSEGIR